MPESIGLVLAGGGVRGAYEIGALSVLLPWLEKTHSQCPDIIVGTSVGALNAVYLAAHASEDRAKLVDSTRGALPSAVTDTRPACHPKTEIRSVVSRECVLLAALIIIERGARACERARRSRSVSPGGHDRAG